MLTQEQVKKSIRTNTPTKGYVSGVRPTNFVDKKTAFNSYQKAKKDNYVGDFITFVDGLEKKGFPVENSDQIRKSKAKAQYLEQKRKNTQLKMMKKIPISEASTSDIWDDFTKTLGDNFSVAGAPVAGALQGFADIGQGAVGKPVEFMAKKFLGLFGYDDESVESLTTQSDLTKGFNKTGAKIGRETGKIVGTLPIGGGTSSVALKGLKGIPYMKEIAKRLAMGAGEGFLGGVSYNVATTDSIGTPTDLGLTTLIGAGFRGLPIIGNELTPLVSKIPGIKNQLAQKLQLNGLMNRTKIENLQNILRQGGAEDLAMGKPEDVAEWMFQRGLEGNKTTIMSKLDDIAEASMDMVDIKLNKIQGLYKVDTIDNILGMLGKEYDGAVSKEFQDKFKKVVTYLAKNKKGGLEIKEINEIKRMVYKDLNPYTASGKVKASSADVASANRELKNFIEDVAEQAGVTTDGMTIRLLNNEFAMADAMKKAISQKDSLDAVSNVLNFISHSGGPMAIGGIAGSNIGPFDSNTTAGKLGNIVVGALVGKTLASTSVSTKVAKWIRNIPETQKAKILTVLEKGTDNITDAEKNTLLQSFKNLDVDVSDDAFVDFSMKADDIMPDNIPNNVVDSVGEIITAPAVQEQQTLPEMLKQASEVDLKSMGFTPTMIKRVKSFSKASPAESATQSIAGKADEVLKTHTPLSKVDDALPVGEKMGNTKQIASVGESVDLTSSIKKAKSEGKTFEEFFETKADDYVKSTKEYKDWAKGSKNIIEAYHGTPYSFDKFEIGKKQAGAYELDTISFATKKSNAEPFSRQYPDWYYKEKKVIDSKYDVSDILEKQKVIDRNKGNRTLEAIKKQGEQYAEDVNKLRKKDGEWLYNNNYSKFKERNKFYFDEIEKLEKEYNRIKQTNIPEISKKEMDLLTKYNKEVKQLEDKAQGNIYKVYIKGKNIIDEIGEEIGFSNTRNSIAAELDGDILRIKDADTGQYIGEEIIVNNPDQIFIVNSPKNKAQLRQMRDQTPTPAVGLPAKTGLKAKSLESADLTKEEQKLRGYGRAEKDIAKRKEAMLGKSKLKVKDSNILDNLNPTGGVFVEYTPQTRATMKLGYNITTLDKTLGKSPDEMITIYRGAPKSQKSIVPGDFISTNKEVAKSYIGDDGHIISKQVKLKDVLDDIDEPSLGEESIYRPQTTPTPTTSLGKPLPKVDNTLLSEARKYKSADEFVKGLPSNTYITKIDTNKFKKGSKIIILNKEGELYNIMYFNKKGQSKFGKMEKLELEKIGVDERFFDLGNIGITKEGLRKIREEANVKQPTTQTTPTLKAPLSQSTKTAPKLPVVKKTPLKQASESVVEDSLLTEARKHKTADEFIEYAVNKAKNIDEGKSFLELGKKYNLPKKYMDELEKVGPLGKDYIKRRGMLDEKMKDEIINYIKRASNDSYMKDNPSIGILTEPETYKAQLRKIREEANKTK